MLRALLQPRYAALSVLMLIVAGICTAAGVWQVVRLDEKVLANDELRGNEHAAITPVSSVLPLVGAGAKPSTDAIKYRTVSATGQYRPENQVLVRQRSIGDGTGYLVLTPLRTADGANLLVVRGFIAADTQSTAVPTVPAPPSGSVSIQGRIAPGETRNDRFADLPDAQVESINPVQQAARLGSVYNGYAELLAGQPGTSGLTEIPTPDLSNPAGGAIEPQHIAYVIQWFLFAALALAAPFAMIRAETRIKRPGRRSRDLDPDRDLDGGPPDAKVAESDEPSQPDAVAERLAQRYGRAGRHLN